MAADRSLGDFGSKLRETRERRGVSLRQIADATKITVSALEALERNDISRLPGGIFSRAFVRAYAVEVGLDPEETIRDFIAQFPHDSVTAGHPTREQAEDHVAVDNSRRMADVFLRLVLVSVPIAGVLLYFGVYGRPAMPPALEPAAPVEAAATRPPPPPVAVDATAAAEPKAAPADRLTVTLSATGPCWVSATVDGQTVLERMLQPGEERTLDVRRDLVLTAGDAAAIAMKLNGAEAQPLGRAGEVVTRQITLANFKEYLAVR